MDFLGAIGTAARGLNAYNDEDERLRKQAFDEADAAIARAKKKYEGLQEAGKGLLLAGRNQEAEALIPGVRGAFNEAYGQNLPIPSIVGEPVMARGQEMVGGKMVPTPYTYDTGKRDFDNPRTTAGLRAGLMLGAPKPEENDLMAVSPYEDLIDKRTMKVVRAGREKPVTADKPRYDVDPVSGEIKPVVPGVRFGVKPDQSYSKAVTDWQQDRLMWVKDYVHLRTSANKKQTRDALGNVTTYQVPPTREEIDAWTKEAEAMYDSRRPMPPPPSGVGRQDPFGNPNTPGGAAAQPAGKPRGPLKVQRSKIPVPTKYEDTALLPAWEGYAQEALTLAPGASISSRARSEARNAQAGGAADSWHKHRQAFDLVNYKPADKARLKAWANSRGLYMLDEGDHLHFQPVQGVEADTAPRLAAFYQRHGIAPQEA